MTTEEAIKRVQALLEVELQGKEFDDYQQLVLCLQIELLRAIDGDQFVLGFLQGAIDSIESGNPVLMNKEAMH